MKKIISLFGFSLLLIANTVSANGFYAVGEFGRLFHDDLPNISGTDKDTIEKYGYHVALGYDVPQQGNYDLGAMIGFGYYGKTMWNDSSNNAPYSYTMYGYDFQGVATYHATPAIDFKAHGGAVLMQDNVINNFVSDNKDHTRPIIGAGASWNFRDNLGLTFDFDHIFGQSIDLSNFGQQPSVDAYWLGLIYHFGGRSSSSSESESSAYSDESSD